MACLGVRLGWGIHILRGAPWGLISEAKLVCRLHGLLQKQELKYEKRFSNMKCPELSKEFGDVFRIWLASIPTAAEAAEVDLVADGRGFGCILPCREKSIAAGNLKLWNRIPTILTDMVHSFSSSILYGLFQYVASKFPPKLVPGGQERALIAVVILNLEFRAMMDFSQ